MPSKKNKNKNKGDKQEQAPAQAKEPEAEPAAEAEVVDPETARADAEKMFLEAVNKFRRERNMPEVEEISEEELQQFMASLSDEERNKLLAQLQGKMAHAKQEDQKELASEISKQAEAKGLPSERDLKHMTTKMMEVLKDDPEGSVNRMSFLEAFASTPILLRLAVQEAQGERPYKAQPENLDAIENALKEKKIKGWTQELPKRAPFVRRNLLLLFYRLYGKMLGVEITEDCEMAQLEATSKVAKLLDMLLMIALEHRWIQAALDVTDLTALITNGLWDSQDDECRAIMKKSLEEDKLYFPKLDLEVQSTGGARQGEATVGTKLTVRVEATRKHAHTGDRVTPEMKMDAITNQGQEGWWMIVEGIRPKGVQNTLIGRAPMLVTDLSKEKICSSFDFVVPDQEGVFKYVVHMRNTTVVGCDFSKKYEFTVVRDDCPALE